MKDIEFTNHTQGEWTINPAETAYESIGIQERFKDKPGFKFYEIARVEWNEHSTLQEREANARLIAAAPALLKERDFLRKENEKLKAEIDKLNNNECNDKLSCIEKQRPVYYKGVKYRPVALLKKYLIGNEIEYWVTIENESGSQTVHIMYISISNDLDKME